MKITSYLAIIPTCKHKLEDTTVCALDTLFKNLLLIVKDCWKKRKAILIDTYGCYRGNIFVIGVVVEVILVMFPSIVKISSLRKPLGHKSCKI